MSNKTAINIEEGCINNEVNKKIIKIASDWTVGYLNNLGGDFSIVELNGVQATIANRSSCPCFDEKNENSNTALCNSIERIINDCIRKDDPDLSAGFVCCSCSKDAVCTLIINLDQ